VTPRDRPPDRRVTDANASWLFDVIQKNADTAKEGHDRLRTEIEQLWAVTTRHHETSTADATEIKLLLREIQTERRIEKDQHTRRTALLSSLVASGIMALFKFAEWAHSHWPG
jgi:hypothetical protein